MQRQRHHSSRVCPIAERVLSASTERKLEAATCQGTSVAFQPLSDGFEGGVCWGMPQWARRPPEPVSSDQRPVATKAEQRTSAGDSKGLPMDSGTEGYYSRR